MNNAFSKKSVFCNNLYNQKDFRQLDVEKASYLLSIATDRLNKKELAEEADLNVSISIWGNSHRLKNIQNLNAYTLQFLNNSCIDHLQCNPFYISIGSFKEFSYSENSTCTFEFKESESEKTKYHLDDCTGGTMNNIHRKKNIQTD
jgi:hypothetical protein